MPDYQPQYANSYALVIGINSYRNPAFQPLGNAEEDARAFADLLAAPPLNFNVQMLLGSRATKQAILAALYDLRQTTPDDRIVVYFAGHGYSLKNKLGFETGYLAAVDTEPQRDYTAVELDEVIDLRLKAPAKHVSFVFDACYSGQVLGITRAAAERAPAASLLTRAAYQAISAATGDQTAGDARSMTDALIDAIRSLPPGPDGLMTLNEVAAYVQQEVNRRSKGAQLPQFGHLTGSQGGDLIFYQAEVADDGTPATPPSFERPAPATPQFSIPYPPVVIGAAILVVALLIAIIIAVSSGGGDGEIAGGPTSTPPDEISIGNVTPTFVANAGGEEPSGVDSPTPTASATPTEEITPVAPTAAATEPGPQPTLNPAQATVITASNVSLVYASQVIPMHDDGINGIAFDASGLLLASASRDGTASIWHLGDQKQYSLGQIAGGIDAEAVAFTADGRKLYVSSDTPNILIWDAVFGLPAGALRGHTDYVYALALNPDSTRLASDGRDQTILLWDVATSERLFRFGGHKGSVLSLAWSPDGSRLASVSTDKTFIIWDVQAGEALLVGKGQVQRATSVAWSPDGNWLVTGYGDGLMILWVAETAGASRLMAHHQGDVTDLAWSPDGSVLASASADGTVALWDMTTGQVIADLRGHAAGVKSLAWSPYGGILASASLDGHVILWEIAPTNCLLTVRARGPQNLRAAPDASSEDNVVATVNPGETLPVLGQSADGAWVQVSYHAQRLWLAAVSAGLSDSCGALPVVGP